jgi:membrane protease YdiL (CAAX protease family)
MPVRLRLLGLGQLIMVALTLFASSRFGGRPREVLALDRVPGGWRTYAGALLGLVALQLLLSGVQRSFGHDMGTDLRPFVDLVRGPDGPLVAAVVAVGAPLSEELVFRGFLLSALARTSLGFWGAALLANLPWTALHWGYSTVGLLEVFLIGLFFSWLLWRTGSLRVPILCHAVFNGLVLAVLRFVDLPSPA